ncbi:unnamed protein product [Cuscuta epithymum]|uniref:Prolamin-like domain-containing protein n=1 Tax=Cuscuta epithymum TaxID=186058 RepID=A0AAV0C861_9ASTE|nr:unnamed protein product [Cuscuta epithymum]
MGEMKWIVSLWFLFIIANSNRASTVEGREIPAASPPAVGFIAGHRLETDSAGCWDALWEIKSCMSEIEAYFINGTIDIGAECCEAITTITRHCWPAVLSGIGVSPEESDILRGYCDAARRIVASG